MTISLTNGKTIVFEYYPDGLDKFRFRVDKRWKRFDLGKLTYSEDFNQDMIRHAKDFTCNFNELYQAFVELCKEQQLSENQVKSNLEYLIRLCKIHKRIKDQAIKKLEYANKKKSTADQTVIIRNLREFNTIRATVLQYTEHVITHYTEHWAKNTTDWLEYWAKSIEGKNLFVVLQEKYPRYEDRVNMERLLEPWFKHVNDSSNLGYYEKRQGAYRLITDYKDKARQIAKEKATAMVEHYADNLAFKTATFMKDKVFAIKVTDIQCGSKGLSAFTTFTSDNLSFAVKSQSVFAQGVIKSAHYRYLMTFHNVVLNQQAVKKKASEKQMIGLIK